MYSLQRLALTTIIQNNAQIYTALADSQHLFSHIFYSRISDICSNDIQQIALDCPSIFYHSLGSPGQIESESYNFVVSSIPSLLQLGYIDITNENFPSYLVNKHNILNYLHSLPAGNSKLVLVAKLASNIMDSQIAETIAEKSNDQTIHLLCHLIGKHISEQSTISVICKYASYNIDKLVPHININSESIAHALIDKSWPNVIHRVIPAIHNYLDDLLVVKCAKKIMLISMLASILNDLNYKISYHLHTVLLDLCTDSDIHLLAEFLAPVDHEMTFTYIQKCNEFCIPDLVRALGRQISLLDNRNIDSIIQKCHNELISDAATVLSGLTNLDEHAIIALIDKCPPYMIHELPLLTNKFEILRLLIQRSSNIPKLANKFAQMALLDNPKTVLELVDNCQENCIHSLTIRIKHTLTPNIVERIIERCEMPLHIVPIAAFTKSYLTQQLAHKLIDKCPTYEICDLAYILRSFADTQINEHLLRACAPSQLNKLKFIIYPH